MFILVLFCSCFEIYIEKKILEYARSHQFDLLNQLQLCDTWITCTQYAINVEHDNGQLSIAQSTILDGINFTRHLLLPER